ncbi:hypothetical protein [Clavibacter tessellarius]|uniref:hypothetical protein n=1 Tax=Clavibacter tessellarius TaxID=31965 RepID=UPI0032537F86
MLILSGSVPDAAAPTVLAPTVPAPHGPEERADAAAVARAEARGELVRLRAGVHVDRRDWEAVSARERHLLRIRALARTSATPLVLGGASAAAVHGLPRIAPWPTLVTLLDLPDAPPGRRAGTRIVRDPAQGRSALVPVADGIRAPGLAAAALAASHDAAMEAVRSAAPRGPGWFAHGIVALDAALAAGRPVRVTRSETRGGARAARARPLEPTVRGARRGGRRGRRLRGRVRRPRRRPRGRAPRPRDRAARTRARADLPGLAPRAGGAADPRAVLPRRSARRRGHPAPGRRGGSGWPLARRRGRRARRPGCRAPARPPPPRGPRARAAIGARRRSGCAPALGRPAAQEAAARLWG